jgi:preprotein translocase subunit YajC
LRTTASFFQNIPPAPGGQPAPAAPAQQQQPAGAPPSEGPGGAIGTLFPILLLLPLLLLMFWSSRSQQKKAAALVAGLKKGDRVLTQSGMIGKLIEIGDRYAKVEVAPGVKIEILKSGLLGKDTPETAAQAEQKK